MARAHRGTGDGEGLLRLPGGVLVRGRRIRDASAGADFSLLLAPGPAPPWSHRRVRWPDFWIPTDRDDAVDALRATHRLAVGGARVEVACRGGMGRTGTALAALAVLDGLTPGEAVGWVRAGYHPRAVETPWQAAWLRHLTPTGEVCPPRPGEGRRPRSWGGRGRLPGL